MVKQIEIGGETYDVLSSLEDIDKYDSRSEKLTGEHTLMELHKVGSKSLTATHILKIYENPKKIYFFTSGYEKKPKITFLNPRKAVRFRKYFNKKLLTPEDIRFL